MIRSVQNHQGLEAGTRILRARVVELERLVRQSGGDISMEFIKDYLEGRLEMLQIENAELKERFTEAAAKQDTRTQQVATDLAEARGLLESMRIENANLKEEKKLWKDIQDLLSQDNENLMGKRTRLNDLAASDLSEITGIIYAVTTGDLTQQCVIEPAETDTTVVILKRRINDMINHFRRITTNVTVVSREHGKEGVLGGEVRMSTVNGVWKEMIDNGTFISFVRS